jgi:hypothetical protein
VRQRVVDVLDHQEELLRTASSISPRVSAANVKGSLSIQQNARRARNAAVPRPTLRTSARWSRKNSLTPGRSSCGDQPRRLAPGWSGGGSSSAGQSSASRRMCSASSAASSARWRCRSSSPAAVISAGESNCQSRQGSLAVMTQN